MQEGGKKKNQHKINVLNKYQQVFQANAQWGKIEYKLQLSYANVSATLKRVFSIVNTVNQTKFSNKHEGKTLLDFIITENQLKPPEDFTSVCQKGFQQIMNLTYGHIQLQKLKQSQEHYQIMICRAAIGKTFIFPGKNVTQSVPLQERPQLMTQQFDSLFIYNDHDVTKDFKQNYLIYKSNQNILPLYIVHFTINQTKYRQLRQKITCQLCDQNMAKKYCQTQDAYLCIPCDQTHHPHTNRLQSRHKRTDLTQKPKIISSCPIHINIKLQLFCLECNRPICVNCKIKGDHSSGQFLMHNLIRVTQKYNQTAKMLKQVDPHLDKKKQNLRKLITDAQTKLKQITRKSNEVQQYLYEIMQRALKQLQLITKYKMSLLTSDHIQLKRQLDQIQWMERFIKYQFDVLSPNDFLLSWERHLMLRKAAIADAFVTNKVLPDMKLQGNIIVTTEEQSRKGDIDRQQRSQEQSQKLKSTMFRKNQQKTNQLLKSKITHQDLQVTSIKSRNNFLNLSILKHI